MRHDWHHVVEEIQPPIRNYVSAAIAATYQEAELLNGPYVRNVSNRTVRINNLVAWLNSWRFKQYIEGLGDCAEAKSREIYEVLHGGATHIRALLQEHEAQEQELDKRDKRRWARNKKNDELDQHRQKRESKNTLTG